jgi:hypothetical protein
LHLKVKNRITISKKKVTIFVYQQNTSTIKCDFRLSQVYESKIYKIHCFEIVIKD